MMQTSTERWLERSSTEISRDKSIAGSGIRTLNPQIESSGLHVSHP